MCVYCVWKMKHSLFLSYVHIIMFINDKDEAFLSLLGKCSSESNNAEGKEKKNVFHCQNEMTTCSLQFLSSPLWITSSIKCISDVLWKIIIFNLLYFWLNHCRSTKEAFNYEWLEHICVFKKARCWGFIYLPSVISLSPPLPPSLSGVVCIKGFDIYCMKYVKLSLYNLCFHVSAKHCL